MSTESLRRALLVGINSYDNFGSLGGCINDVDALFPLLARHENDGPNFSCQTRHNISRDKLKRDIDLLLSPGADIALLYFAGHGMTDGNDVSLCTKDGSQETPGFPMSQVLGMAAESTVAEVVIVLDCCFAGAAGAIPQIGAQTSLIRNGVSILAASRGDQPSAEQADHGVFSRYLAAALDGGAADVLGKITVAGVYAYLSELFGPWDQRPTFKANVDRLHELRRCKATVPAEDIRRLHDLFPTPDHDYPLDPSYEPDAEPQNAEHQDIFATLQRCRAAKLVEPVGHEHMYFAAMQSLSCRLTPLGQHYWRLADRELL